MGGEEPYIGPAILAAWQHARQSQVLGLVCRMWPLPEMVESGQVLFHGREAAMELASIILK